MRYVCLDCGEEAVERHVLCLPHLRHDDEAVYVALYCVMCILYYRHSASPWTDGQFDGIAYWLLKAKAYKRWDFLERDMLMSGSGYDVDSFPAEYHRLAEEMMK